MTISPARATKGLAIPLSETQRQQIGFNTENYQITHLLGQGGMAKVYLAEDIRLHRNVAIKILNPSSDLNNNLSNEQNQPPNGLTEARLLARFNHPNIVQLYDIVQKNGQTALIMEYLPGLTLAQVMREQVVSFNQKLQWLYQICLGLAAAHQMAIVHGDLKLANIMLGNNNAVKIADFGISESLIGQTKINSSGSGSPTTMSPEQLQHQPIDHHSDLFSLGIVACQLLTGSHPFGDDSSEIAQRIIHESPMDISNINPAISPNLAQLVNQLLAKNPQQRPDSSADVAQRLRQILIASTQQEILSEQTLIPSMVTQTTADNSSMTNRRFNVPAKPLALTMVLVLLMSIVIGWLMLQDLTPPMRYIVVLPPSYTSTNPEAKIQQTRLMATVDGAIRQRIINHPTLQLISRAEVAAVKGNLKQIGQATGATDIITTELDCHNNRCDITFSRLNGTTALVEQQQHWQALAESYTAIYQMGQLNFITLYPALEFEGLTQHPVSEPDYRRYLDLYQLIAFEGKSTQQTLEQLSELLTRSPYLLAGYSLYRKAAIALYNHNRDLTSLLQLQSLMQSAPPEYRYSVTQAMDAFWVANALGEMEQARQYLTLIEKRGASRPVLIGLQADWFRVNKQQNNAIEAYQTLLKLRPSTTLMHNLALSYWWVSDFDAAKQTLQQLLRIIPNHYRANQLLASIFLLEGDIEQAIVRYEKIIEGEAKSTDLSNLSLAYSLAGRHQQALTLAALAVKQSPTHPTWLLNLADAQWILGHKQQALAHYQQVITLHQGKTDVKSWLERAQAHVHQGDGTAAVKALHQAVKAAPDNAEVAFTAALVYSQLGENTSALAQVEASLSADIGVIWFNLPWFDGLCGTPEFSVMMRAAGNPQRCMH